ncbi:hypothetical protein EI546_09400 [Aequorivita sp. H23M31]|uniref:Uncharacterized protein n=1 Tax=Aequorivita ciconiae TaxID=2494375 RepID=A0A410G3U2_9FLAO|nr:hypothetical protein [Aequorivita sp. H23M31]QAA81923.1 hypothetical protein EI546_09400 [Aequorivita sp. H23M31]
MKNFINITIAFILGLAVNAQTGIQTGGGGFQIFTKASDMGQRYNSLGLTDSQFNSIKSGMYANMNFIHGNIFENGEKIAADLPMRYNAYTDDIEVKLKSSDANFQPLKKIPNLSVKTPLDYYIFLEDNGKKEESGFVNVLVDGDQYKLYKKITVSFQPAAKGRTSYESDTPASFKQNIFYYLVHDGNLMEVPNSKGKIIDFLDKENSKMKDYIKKNKIDVRNEAGLIKAISHLESL